MSEKEFRRKARETGLSNEAIKEILSEVAELEKLGIHADLSDYLIEPVISD